MTRETHVAITFWLVPKLGPGRTKYARRRWLHVPRVGETVWLAKPIVAYEVLSVEWSDDLSNPDSDAQLVDIVIKEIGE